MFLYRPRMWQTSFRDFISPLDKNKSIDHYMVVTWEWPPIDVIVVLFN